MAATMPEVNQVTIPGLKSTGKNNSRLLRRPRAPPKLPPIPNDVPSTTPSENLSPTQQFFDRFDYSSPYDAQMMGYLNRESPTPSLASPPPSASSPTRHTFNMHNFTSPTSNVTSFISKDDMRYVLDPLYRGRTALGTYVDGKSLLKPFKPRGPDGLPPRKPKKNPELMYFESDDMRYYKPPAFTLETFAAHVSQVQNIPLCQVQKMFHSRATYDKLTQLLYEENIQKKYDTVYIQKMDGSQLPMKEPRVPQMQLLIEMAAMIKQHVRDLMQTNVKSVIKPMPKYSPSYRGESVPHTEIILYEDDSVEKASQRMQLFRETEMPSKDSVFKSATTRHFMGGSGRSHSPLTLPENEMISPSELAILDSLISGGSALSLKAHFIAELPDITPLMKSITYLNLSFNNFKSFPLEVLRITQLEILKMRDNPLRDLPPDIHRLENLRTLVVSFCLVETIPSGLYQIKTLQHLDVSYNKLTSLSSEMRNLENLCELNVEGNQLPALPGGALRLPLTSVNVRNNFMHPLFWKDYCKNKPQRLTDLAALHFVRNNLHKQIAELPEAVVKVLYTCETCDTCLGPLFGPGLTCIRPIRKAFGIRMLPFLFRSCQPSCLHNFRACSSADLYQLLYGVEAEAEPAEEPPQEAEPNAPTPSPR